MTPLERYQIDLNDGGFRPDPAQEQVVRRMQEVYDAVLASPVERRKRFLSILSRRAGHGAGEPVAGLYIWGGVGRGKTHLVNNFHDSLPITEKWRVHFHRFMQYVHGELKRLKETVDPLQIVAERVAGKARVLCLDEFHVSDIADAMLLGRLLEALFARGVTLVATSNVAPDELYQGGLQRERFVPAIELIKQHTRVVHVGGNEDFRLRALEQAEIYHAPLDAGAERSLLESFHRLSPENVRKGVLLEIEGRSIATVRLADGIAWFEFKALCDGPRSTADYIEIARCFHTVLVSNIPLMGPEDVNKAARFIHLVDEFYDRNVNLIVSAAAPPAELYYPEGRLVFEFERTQSRLEEMRSREYLARKHLP